MTINPKSMRIFRYSQEETRTFPYLKSYTDLINRDPPCGDDLDAAERYMLAGMFLTFRACNHAGVPMTTERIPAGLPERHQKRLSKYKELTCHSIGDQRHYLKRLRYNRLLFATIGPGRMLYRFVRFGRGWSQRLRPHLAHRTAERPEWLVTPE